MKQPFFAAGVDEQGNTLDFIRLHSVVELGVRPGVREKAIGCFEADARGSLHGFESALKLVTGRREKAEVVHCAAFGSSLRIEKKRLARLRRSEEHTSELQSLMRLSYAVFCLTKKTYSNHLEISQCRHLSLHNSYIPDTM